MEGLMRYTKLLKFSRQVTSGTYALVYLCVFIAILVALNWLGVQYNKSYDATSQKLYSLSDQTHTVLNNLDRNVTLTYFDRQTRFAAVEDMLRRYENASSRVTVAYVDPDEDPVRTEQMNVRSYGSLILTIGTMNQEAASINEQDITNALITALKGEERTVCVSIGHGEAASDSQDRNGFTNAVTLIDNANYKSRDVSLALEGVPEDCTILLIGGPSTAYLDPEVDAIRTYLETGGRVLFMLNPVFPDGQGSRPESNPNLIALLGEWGVVVNNDVVIDESPIGQLFGGGPFTPMVSNYEYHSIVEVMTNVTTLFPQTRSISKAGEIPTGWTVDELFETSDTSYATTYLRVNENEVDMGSEDQRTAGPVVLAVAGSYDLPTTVEPEASAQGSTEETPDEETAPQGRIVVIGSSGFAINYGLGLGGNQDLLLNMLNWLSSDEDLISIRPKNPENTPVEMTVAQMNRVFLVSLAVLPLLFITMGLFTWWGRR